jgi:hydrogenase expression/formation protein HypC
MCLAVPGKITDLDDSPGPLACAKVDFGGIVKKVNLAFVPEAAVGDYVLVHVGFAIARVDEAEAARMLDYLRRIDELEGLEEGAG